MSRLTSEEKLRFQVLEELTLDALVDESQIDVDVADGVVTLVGTVGSYAEKLVAQIDAQAVEQVHDIVNAIDVKPNEEMHPSDAELAEIVTQVLAWNALVPEGDLTVSVSEGWVTLGGVCTAAAQRGEAERAIGRLAGVRRVTNDIRLADPEPSIGDIRHVISGALRRRAEHRAGLIDVVVDGRVVTLAGSAQTPLEKKAIVGIVSHAPGVENVLDEIEIEIDPDR